MNTNNNKLSQVEISALVHHVELHKTGWWDKALNRLVLAVIWIENGKLKNVEIKQALKTTFGVEITSSKLFSILDSLKSSNFILEIQKNEFKVSEATIGEFEQEIKTAEDAEKKAKEFLTRLTMECCSDIESNDVWAALESDILLPLVKDQGANTYRFITGDPLNTDVIYIDKFLSRFAEKYHYSLRHLIANFLDPKNENVRKYITRMLHAQFCIEASGLSEEILDKLKAATNKQLKLNLFVDTNFLFSLLGLHENPSNSSALELRELLSKLKSNPQISMYITPRTIKEAKNAISGAMSQVSEIPIGSNFTNAALRTRMSGMSERFFFERKHSNENLTPSDWFDPYLRDFVTLARGSGVELYNESLDAYATRQDVVDDIKIVINHEENTYPVARRKTYGKVAHDMILWHFVKDKRPEYIESPMDARDWVLTVDFRLIGFDQHKQNRNGHVIPMCLHPTSLIQLLQFWVPRTKEFEEAILGGLRLPFLFQEFDVHAERTSLKILNKLARFEGSDSIPEETLVNVIMNDGLRSRIENGQSENEEIQLVRDALVEEMRLKVESEKEVSQKLKSELQRKEAVISDSEHTQRQKDERIQDLQKKLSASEGLLKDKGKRLNKMSDKKQELENKLDAIQKDKTHKKTLRIYITVLCLIIVLSIYGGCMSTKLFASLGEIIGSYSSIILLTIVIFIFSHLILEIVLRRKVNFANLWAFKQVRRFQIWLWGFFILVAIGVIVGVIVNNIKMYNLTKTPSTQHKKIGFIDSSDVKPVLDKKNE